MTNNDAQTREKIIGIIYDMIDELNAENDEIKVVKAPDTVLLGKGSPLDSLMLVNLIVGTEQRIEEAFGFPISAIANEKAMSLKNSPLRSIGSLAEFIAGIVKEQSVGKNNAV